MAIKPRGSRRRGSAGPIIPMSVRQFPHQQVDSVYQRRRNPSPTLIGNCAAPPSWGVRGRICAPMPTCIVAAGEEKGAEGEPPPRPTWVLSAT